MTSRRLPVPLGLAALLALPAAAPATHLECRWGARADVDPSRSDPVRYGVSAPTWGCPGPVVRIGASALGHTVAVHGSGSGVRYAIDEPAPRDGEAGTAPQPAEARRVRLLLAVAPGSVRAGRRSRIVVRSTWMLDGAWAPADRVRIRVAGRTARTDGTGMAVLRLRLRRAGRVRVVAAADGQRATARLRVLPAHSRHARR